VTATSVPSTQGTSSRHRSGRASRTRFALDGGLTYLAYGTREPSDVCHYPRSNKIFLRGVGLIARLEPLDTTTASPTTSSDDNPGLPVRPANHPTRPAN
jgi:hypothetical protein